MMRGRDRPWRVAMAMTSATCALLPCRPALTGQATATIVKSTGKRPNIVLVMTDDQGYGDIGLHGNTQIKTPNIDRFARNGIELTRFYCSPVCAPTRASLMTGRNYYRTGVIHTSRGAAKMHGDEVTVAELLQSAGYRTGIFGKWHLGDNYPMRPQDQGFEESLVHKSGGIGQTPDKPNSYSNPKLRHNGHPVTADGYCTDVFFDAALRFIDDHRGEPFFVYLPTNAPHTPLEIMDEYVAPYKAAGLDDTTARVYGMVTNIDDNFGRLLNHLDKAGLRDNTLVIFLTDNGAQQKRFNAELRGRKSWTYEGGIRVPCFVQWPAQLEAGIRLPHIAAHIDLMPTILDACDVEIPSNLKLDGISLLRLLRSHRTIRWRDRSLFFQCHRGLAPKRFQNCAVVTQRFKLVGYPGTFGQEDLTPSADRPVLELYDIANDPSESNNLAETRPDIVVKLRADYERWFADVSSTRRFQPGVIHIDPDVEDPTHLCRYQDGNWRDGRSHGWDVKIARSGRFRVSINRGDTTRNGQLHVTWQGRTQSAVLPTSASAADVELQQGRGVLDIWWQPVDGERLAPGNNSTVGDVTIQFMQ